MNNPIRHPFDSGFSGSTFISGTTQYPTTAGSTSYYAIQIISNAVFNTLTGNINGDSIAGATIPAGTILYGSFTAIKLTSGSVIAYSN